MADDSLQVPVQDVVGGTEKDISTPNGVELSNLVPEQFRDKPYIKNIKDVNDLFTQFDNAQKVIGSRPGGIPEDGATEEEIEKFYNSLRPKEQAGYDNISFQDGVDDTFKDSVRQMFFDAGLSKKQAEKIMSGFDQLTAPMLQQKQEAEKQKDIEFDQLATKVFGTNQETVINTAHKMLQKYAPAELKGHIAGLSNEQLLVLGGTLYNINRQHFQEDAVPDNTGISDVGNTVEELSNQARQLMSSKEYRDPMHPQHDATRKKVDDAYEKMRVVLSARR